MHNIWIPTLDNAKIIGYSAVLHQPLQVGNARMLSTSGSGAEYDRSTLSLLLKETINDIVHNPINRTKYLGNIVGRAKLVRIWTMGPSHELATVTDALEASGIKYRVNEDLQIPRSMIGNSRGGSGQIAIVGMGGRFPGNDTIDGFWQDLIDGKCHIGKARAAARILNRTQATQADLQ
jgi:hypothetical protein